MEIPVSISARTMSDNVYLVLKLTGSLVAATAGVIGTISDLRVDRNGNKVLSRGGYAVLACLILGTLVSMTTDYHKESSDAAAARDARTKLGELVTQAGVANTKLESTNTNLEKQVAKSQAISDSLSNTQKNLDVTRHEAQRAAAPLSLKDMSAAVELRLPADNKLLRPYLDRARALESLSPYSKTYKLGDAGFPNLDDGEKQLDYFVREMYIDVIFLKKVPKAFDDLHNYGDLEIVIFCGSGSGKASDRSVEPAFKQNGDPYDITVRCETSKVKIDRDVGAFRSFVDLIGSTAYAKFYCDYCGEGNYEGELFAPVLERIVITTSDNRAFELTFYGRKSKTCPLGSPPCFETTINESALWISRR